jgi:hypothetical protein
MTPSGLACKKVACQIEARFTANTELTKRLILFERFRSGLAAGCRADL